MTEIISLQNLTLFCTTTNQSFQNLKFIVSNHTSHSISSKLTGLMSAEKYKYETCFRKKNSVKLITLLLYAEFRAKYSSCHVVKIQSSTAEDPLLKEDPN